MFKGWLLAVFFVILLLAAEGNRVLTWIIYPPLHRDQISAWLSLERIQKLLPNAASISLQVLEHGPRNLPKVALTFDADMTPAMKLLLDQGAVKSWYNAAVKETLDQEKAEATVFLGGLWTKTYPVQAKALALDPLIEIGNHSYNHYAFAAGCYNLPVLADEGDIDDVATAQKIIAQTTGVIPKYFRFPGGCQERVSLQTVASLGLTVVGWDVPAGDGFNNDTDSIVRQVENNVQNGSIVVLHLHDGTYAPKTAEVLKKIIPDLRARGFQFVKLSEL